MLDTTYSSIFESITDYIDDKLCDAEMMTVQESIDLYRLVESHCRDWALWMREGAYDGT
jgi:hypothetical protein